MPNVALNQIHIQLWGHLRFQAQKAVWRSVVYHALAAHAFSAGIKCWHCRSTGHSIIHFSDREWCEIKTDITNTRYTVQRVRDKPKSHRPMF